MPPTLNSLHGIRRTRRRTALRVLSLVAALCPFVLSDAGGQETPADDGEFGIPEAPAVTLEQTEAEIARLQALPDDQNADRAQLLELHRAIREDLTQAAGHAATAREHHAAISSAPPEAERLRAELEAEAEDDPPFPVPILPADAPAEQVQNAVRSLRNSLEALRATLSETEKTERSEAARLLDPAAWQAEVDAVRNDLQDVRDQLAETGPVRENPEVSRLRRLSLEARLYRLLCAEVALAQEQASNAARVELLNLRAEKLRRQVRSAGERLEELEARLASRRVAEAEVLLREVAALRGGPNGSIAAIAAVLTRCETLAAESIALAESIDAMRDEQTRLSEELARVRQIDDEIARIVEQFERTRSLGPLLLERLRALPTRRQYETQLDRATSQLEDARFRQFELETLSANANNAARSAARTARATSGEDSAAVARSAAQDLSAAHAAEVRLIDRLLQFNRERQTGLGRLEADTRALLENIRSSTDRIRRHILWTRSALPLSRKTLAGVPASFHAFIAGGGGKRFPEAAIDDLFQHPVPYSAVAAIALAALLARRPLIRRLEILARRVGRVGEDRVLHTIEAIGITLVLALPLPALFVFPAYRILSGTEAGEEARAVAVGLVHAGTALAWALFIYGLCRRHGLLRGHFRWPAEVIRQLRQWLGAVFLVAIPMRFLIYGSNARHAALVSDSPGRILFILWMIILCVALVILLNPRKGVFAPWLEAHPGSLLSRLRYLWYFLFLLEPLYAAGLAATGYYYSALELDRVFSHSVWILVFGVFAHALLLRWILVSHRRLAYRIALEKRRAQQKAREETEGPQEEIEPLPDPDDEIDVVEIDAQNRALLRTAVGLAVFFSLLAVWSPLLPAFEMLRDVTLWSVSRVVDGQKQYVPITLFSLLVSLTALGVTAIAARNLPGFLEISLLQRLKLDTGTRYAMRTIANYLIVAFGLIYAFTLLGIGWSSIQWLVAALSLGLGFGLQEIFANFVSGIILLVERPVRVGDTVTVKNVSGIVTRIRMRATTITDWDRKELVVPNRYFITSELVNWTLTDPVLRMTFNVGVAYGTDTALAHRVLLDTIRSHPMILEQPPADVFFLEFAESSLRFEVRVFVAETTNLNRTQVKHDLHMAIERACREHGIEIAFPQRDLHLRSIDGVLRIARAEPAPETGPDEEDPMPKNTRAGRDSAETPKAPRGKTSAP